jgi:hypothetical protein
MNTKINWGPFSPACKGHAERKAQLRCLQGIIACHHGSDHPLITLLRAAEHDAMRFVEAFDAMEKMPALYRRRVLSVLSAVTWPQRPYRPSEFDAPEWPTYDADADDAEADLAAIEGK